MKKLILVIVVAVVVVGAALYLQRTRVPGEPEGEAAGEVAAPEAPPAAAEMSLESAGEVTDLIPEAWAERREETLELAIESPVYWRDEVWTEDAARMRLALTDGSILNLGSDVRLRIVEHELKSARSELLLTLGKLRAQVTHQPEKRFEVRTNTAIVGVIGTQFYVEALAEMTVVICLEGRVQVRNVREEIAGEVVLRAGERTIVFQDQPPTPAEPASPADLAAAEADTSVTQSLPTERAEGATLPPVPATGAAAVTGGAGVGPFAVLTVSDSTFDSEVMQSELPVLVEFWASWAAPSRRLAPTVESVAREYGGRLLVAKVNVDENGDTARRWQVQSVPTLVLFRDGEEVGRVAGTVQPENITALLDSGGIAAE